jgi:hypothetical protein
MLAALGCLLLWTVTAAAATARKEHALKVGKKGEICNRTRMSFSTAYPVAITASA